MALLSFTIWSRLSVPTVSRAPSTARVVRFESISLMTSRLVWLPLAESTSGQCLHPLLPGSFSPNPTSGPLISVLVMFAIVTLTALALVSVTLNAAPVETGLIGVMIETVSAGETAGGTTGTEVHSPSPPSFPHNFPQNFVILVRTYLYRPVRRSSCLPWWS